MINDEDCDVEMPVAMDDVPAGFTPSGRWDRQPQSTSSFLLTLRVVREISNLLKILKVPSISPSTLEYHDTQLNNCMAIFPAQHQVQRRERLDPDTFKPMICLQNARLLLHRQNISIVCSAEMRSAAIDQCVMIAKDTTEILLRCTVDPSVQPNEDPSPQRTWTWLRRNTECAFFCTHIWRCTLFLCLRGEFSAASTCVRVSAIMGDARPVNAACGKYLDFFLDHLTQKMVQNPMAHADGDEELIAYVSGDLQGSIEHSWVWEDGEDYRGTVNQSPTARTPAERETSIMSEVETDDFGRAHWDGILEKLDRLLAQKLAGSNIPWAISRSTSGDLGRAASANSSARPPSLPTGSSRISIADII
jgi:hypothetical protein